MYMTDDEHFSTSTKVTCEEIASRLEEYKTIMRNLQKTTINLAHWGAQEHNPILRKIFARLGENQAPQSGRGTWKALHGYPLILLMYSGGIAAIAAEEYTNLKVMFTVKAGSQRTNVSGSYVTLKVGEAIAQAMQNNIFKQLPGHERHYVAISEYLFKLLQPTLDDLLFLGGSFEALFDRFEVLHALVHADLEHRINGHFWGPPGRFGWKYWRWRGNNKDPFSEIVHEAESLKDDWHPLQAGLFDGSYQRFSEVASQYEEEILKNLRWR